MGFEGGEAEVFFAGEEEGAGGLVVLEEGVVGEVSEELDVGGMGGEVAEFFFFGALADDEEGAVGVGARAWMARSMRL